MEEPAEGEEVQDIEGGEEPPAEEEAPTEEEVVASSSLPPLQYIFPLKIFLLDSMSSGVF